MTSNSPTEAHSFQFLVDTDFWALFPEAIIGTVVCTGIDNSGDTGPSAEILEERVDMATAAIEGAEIPALPAVAPWRDAYRRFGVKPSKYRSSIESLLRSAQGRGVPSINPLVNLYNSISLEYLLPCGGEDLIAMTGPLQLTRARGDEQFVGLGSTSNEPPSPGEVIYRDDMGAVCRCWNWREADRTKLTPTTTSAVLIIEALPPAGADLVRQACERLASLLVEQLGGATSVKVITAPESG